MAWHLAIAAMTRNLLSYAVGITFFLPGGIAVLVQTTSLDRIVPTPPPQGSLLPIAPSAGIDQLGVDDQLWGKRSDRTALVRAIDYSLHYLPSEQAAATYRRHPVSGVTRDRVRRSLERFRQLVLTARSATELQTAIAREFLLYRAAGNDGRGTVAFTGYFEPVYVASRNPTQEFRYPIFRQPPDLSGWKMPHPTRLELEGMDGLQFRNSRLQGLELAWLRDRLQAFLIQVQGSARLRLTDGTIMSIGYAGHTHYPYTSIGRELVKAGKVKPVDLTLPVLSRYFEQHPADLNLYLPRNRRMVFFQETGGAPARGSLGIPVTPERSIATDKSKFPAGALAVIQTQLPVINAAGAIEKRLVTRYVLDQDTGAAINGTGRVDIFMGTGTQAGDRAGLINATGSLFYLLLN
jgi:membrane-bound lytic murein transglycosylase A